MNLTPLETSKKLELGSEASKLWNVRGIVRWAKELSDILATSIAVVLSPSGVETDGTKSIKKSEN